MRLESNTILITGGASGIGLALAERFLRAGSQVIICGRRAHKLDEARALHPALHTRVCDLSDPSARVALFEWATREFPNLNVLVNNAGIQRRDFSFTQSEPWPRTHEELAINLEAPIHLTGLFLTHLKKQNEPVIINVTSGLAFVPIAAMPLYCATKAALHSFTLSLRHQLAPGGNSSGKTTPGEITPSSSATGNAHAEITPGDTATGRATSSAIKVIEIIPPAVNTDLGGPGLHTFGVPLNEFADSVFSRLATDELEIAYGFAQQSSQASRAELDQIFARMNAR